MMTNPPQRGFTLIETLVAVTLLAMTIVLPYYAIQRSLQATYSARDDLVASSLAQEALEYVRTVRDTNYLYNIANPSSTRSWLAGLDTTPGGRNCLSPNTCTIDATKSTIATALTQCPASGCTQKLYLSSTGLYNQDNSGTPTRFLRYITIESVSAKEVRVTATVTWFYHGSHSVVITDTLQDWL